MKLTTGYTACFVFISVDLGEDGVTMHAIPLLNESFVP